MSDARYLGWWEVGEERGPAVAIDTIRAFTTSAYALAAGARAIYLVRDVEDALAFKRAHPAALAMGEDGGLKPEGFDFSNSPVAVSRADIAGRVLVQRTSAGTRGALAAVRASRVWCASLVTARATARALVEAPVYVITGRFLDAPERGTDDLVTAQYIEALRTGAPGDRLEVARQVATSDEARRITLALGVGHVHPEDIEYATRVDAFSFAMELTRDEHGLRLDRVEPP